MKLFKDYVSNYDFTNAMIARKYNHTLRVKNLCEIIAKELCLSNEKIYLAGLCGLYHDIARFDQASKFNSFDDISTFDHGDVGYEIFLKDFASKLGLSDEQIMIIANSIKHHNKLNVNDLTGDDLVFTNILRDADKIDIFYQFANVPGMLSDAQGDISKMCHDKFLARKPVSYKDIRNKREQNILYLAFIWDINYECSYKIIKDNKYFQKIQKILNNEIYDEYFEVINKFLKEK